MAKHLPKLPEFFITAQTPEQLVIKFDIKQGNRTMILITIGIFFVGIVFSLAVPLIIPYGSYGEKLALCASIGLPTFWGLDLFIFLMAIFGPVTESFRFDKLKGIVGKRSVYLFGKAEKNTEFLFEDITGLCEQQFNFERYREYGLALELRNGRKIRITISLELKKIQDLHALAQKYLIT